MLDFMGSVGNWIPIGTSGPVMRDCDMASRCSLPVRWDITACLVAIACSPSPQANFTGQLPYSSSTAPAAAPDAGVRSANESRRPNPHPNVMDLESWLSAHEITVSDSRQSLESLEFSYSCEPMTVGSPPRDGILCLGHSAPDLSLQGGVSTFLAIIAIADRGRLRTVLRVPFAAGPADLEANMSREEANYIRLDVKVDTGGKAVTITDRPEAICAQRIKDAADGGPYLTVIKVACSSRGRYVWSAGRFQRLPR
jgi:hypothetical protein